MSEIISYFVFSVAILSFIGLAYFSTTYIKYRREALSTVKKTKITLYCIPSFFSILSVIFFYEQVTDLLSGAWIWVIVISIILGIVLFDLFESRRVKRLKVEPGV